MPTPRTSKDTIQRVYFSAPEACKVLDCPKYWLRYWTEQIGLKTRENGKKHRYSVKDLEKLMAYRTVMFSYRDPMTGKFATLRKRKPVENGHNRYIRKTDSGTKAA